jgi:Tfp pilus assembly protein PilO
MGQLQTIITSSGVSVDGVSYGALVLSSKQPVNEGDFSFALQARGTYTQINTFLTSLTSFNRIVVIDSLSITKESVGESLVNVALDGTAHYKK